MANTNHTGNGDLRRCAFCGRTEHQVKFLIPSPTGVYICDVCVDACADLIDQTLEMEEQLNNPPTSAAGAKKQKRRFLLPFFIGVSAVSLLFTLVTLFLLLL